MITEREIAEAKEIIARGIAAGRITIAVAVAPAKVLFANEAQKQEYQRRKTLERVHRWRSRHRNEAHE